MRAAADNSIGLQFTGDADPAPVAIATPSWLHRPGLRSVPARDGHGRALEAGHSGTAAPPPGSPVIA